MLPVVKDGVVPENVKALLLPDKVREVNEGEAKVGEAVVVISCAAFKVTDPPKDTDPPPVKPVPAVRVKLEFTRFEFNMDDDGRDRPDVTVKDPPTLTLPDVPMVDKPECPVTDSPAEKTPADVTDNDCPTPTLPVETSDPPIPTLPKNPVPETWKGYVGRVVPIPTLPLSKTVRPWVRVAPPPVV